jgi:hypothetical protein
MTCTKKLILDAKKWWLWQCAQAAIHPLILHLKNQWDKSLSQLAKSQIIFRSALDCIYEAT